MGPNSKPKSGPAKDKGREKHSSSSTPKPTPPPKSIKELLRSLPNPAKVGDGHSITAEPALLRRAHSIPSASTNLPNPNTIPVKPKLLKRFYEALVILSILGRNRGDKTLEEEHETEHDAQDLAPNKLRRAFVRNLAYLCDFKRGGDTTTAIALEQTPQGVVYHVASNRRPAAPAEDKARGFLQQILTTLGQVQSRDLEAIEKDMFQKSVKFSSVRILEYGKELKKEIGQVVRHLDPQFEEDAALQNWLRKIVELTGKPKALCQLCFSDRREPSYSSLQHRAKTGQSPTELAKRFEKIRHLIGRLNHTMKAVKLIIDAALRLPHLLSDFKIVREKSSHALPPPLQERNPSLSAIAGRMLCDTNEIENLRLALKDMDRLYGLEAELREQCLAPTWRPRVHAELLLLDKFWTQDLDFVDGDRYIGCSKPACYCCYHYIAAHPGGFVGPACHNNNWLNWRPPDVLDGGRDRERLVKTREVILNKMVERIRQDALRQIMARRGPNKNRPDSLTEISTVRMNALQLSSSGSGDEQSEEDSSHISSCSGDTTAGLEAESDRRSDLGSEEESDDEDEEGGVSLL